MPVSTRKIVPIKGRFEGWRALLANIAENDDIENFVIVTMTKDGDCGFAHFNMTRENLAYAALAIQQKAMEEY